MLAIQRILVATDFTETSDRALDFGIELARKFDATVTVVHAYQIPAMGFADGGYIAGAEVAAQLSTAGQNRLDSVVDSKKTSGVLMKAVLREGVAWEEVNDVAKEIDANLIVIGTHGRRGLARALLGSVAENVIRTSTIPVLVIHGPRDDK
jgi:nucleotide-binding universal stress UspA family protein